MIKTKTWLMLFAALAIVCSLLILVLLREQPCQKAEIWSDGELVAILDLSEPQCLTVDSDNGTNVIEVLDGKICVSEASCPDRVCVRRGCCAGGAPIICLPNRLVICFVRSNGPDAVTG